MTVLHIHEKLYLKPLQESDAPELYELVDRNRHHLAEFLPWVAGTASVSDSLAFINTCLANWDAGTGAQFGVFLNGRLAGTIGIKEIKDSSGELGYWLSHDAVGQGIITQSATALIKYGFEELKLSELHLYCRPSNLRSAAVARRLGFEYDASIMRSDPGGGEPRQCDRYIKIR